MDLDRNLHCLLVGDESWSSERMGRQLENMMCIFTGIMVYCVKTRDVKTVLESKLDAICDGMMRHRYKIMMSG